LSGRTSINGKTIQVNVRLIQEISRVKAVCDRYTAGWIRGGRPLAHVDGVGDVVTTRTNVEDSANADLQLGESRGLVPTPAVAAVAGLGIECDGVAGLVAEGGAEFACSDRGFDNG